MDLPPPPPVNYYRYDYPPPPPPPDFHRFHPHSPSHLHPIPTLLPPPPPPRPPPPPPPSQFDNYIPPRFHHESPRNDFRAYPSNDHHYGDSIRFVERTRFPDSRADLPPPEARLDQRNQRYGQYSSFRPQIEGFRYDEEWRGDADWEFQSRGSKDELFYSRNEFHDSKHTYLSGGDVYPANFRSHDADLGSNLFSNSQSNLANRLVFDDGDKSHKQKRQVTRLEVLPGDRRPYYNNGARYEKNMTGEKFNVSPKKKMKAQRKSVLSRLQSKVEINNSGRSYEEDGFVRAQDDEVMPTVADNHEGKGKKASKWSQRQMEEKRDEGTMELHVSIISNALVAKPIMATSSPVAASSNGHTNALVAKPIMATPSPIVASSKSSMAMDTELEKTGKVVSPSVKSSEETLKIGSSSDLPSHVDEGSRKLKEDVISDDSPTGSLNILSGCDKAGERHVENGNAAETREFEGKIASYGGFPPSSLETSISGGNSTSKQTPGLVISDFQSAMSVVSGGSITESDMKKNKKRKKRMAKREIIMAKREEVVINLTDEKEEKLTNVSQGGVSDLKEVDIEVKPTHTSLSKTSPLTSALSSFEGIDVCESSDHADVSIIDICSASYSENVLVEPQIKSAVCEIGCLKDMQDRPLNDVLLSSDGHTENVTYSTILFCRGGERVGNGLISDCTSKNEKCSASCSEECGPSCSDTRLSIKPRVTLVEDVPSGNGGSEDGFCENNLIQNKNVTNLHPVSTNGITFPSKMQSEQDCKIKLFDTEASGGCLTADLVVRTSLEIPSSNDVSMLPNNASIVIARDSSLARLPTSVVSALDDFGNQNINFDLLNAKRKIDVRDDKLSYHAENMPELGSTHNDDGSSIATEESFNCTKMVRPDNADNMLVNGSPEHSSSGLILIDGRKKRKVSPSRLPLPVLREFDMLPGANTTDFPFNSEKPGFSFTLEEHDTSLGCKIDPCCLKDPSSVVHTTCSAPSGDFCGSTMVCRPDKLQYVGDVLSEGVPEHDMEIPSPELVAGKPEESRLVSSTAGGLHPMNTADSDDRGHIIDPRCLKDPSSVVHTTCSAPSGDFCGSTMVCRPDKLQYVGDVLLEGVPEHDMKISSPELVAGKPEESRLVSSTAGGLHPMNTEDSDDSGHTLVACDMDQKLHNIDVKGKEHLLGMTYPSSPPGAILHADDNRNAFQNAFKSTDSLEHMATTFHNDDSEINYISNVDVTATEEIEIVLGSKATTAFEKSSIHAQSGSKSEDKMVMDLPHNPKNVPSLDGSDTKASENRNILRDNKMNNKWISTSISSSIPHNRSVRFSSEMKRGAISHVAKPRTWHRNGSEAQSVSRPMNLGNHVSSLASAPQDNGKVQNSYIRKGNSLLRKPSPVVSDILKDTRSEKLNVIGLPTSETQGGPDAAHESPETPPIVGSVAIFDPPVACAKPPTVPVCQTNSSSNSDGLNRVVEGNNVKKVTYVKRKLNQLVAASSSGNACIQGKENAQVSSSDGYYKRRKNQLVRTSSEDDVRQRVALPDEGSPSLEAQKNAQDRSFSAKQSGFRQRKKSAVWMRHGSSSFRKQRNLGCIQSVSSFYIPWKKSISWTNLKSSLNSSTGEIPFSIGKRLLLSKKRDATYKRSRSGFSLHRSKALNVGRRSLKWSKSMERSSKRANEDGTLAEKRKTEQSGAGFSLSMCRNRFSRERIFRIGLERYKMDPSGRILQRISDEKASCSDVKTGNNSKKLFLPRRLLIGNGEYVRIGNGNQLIRDPKQRTRVLATEKVRRSLHTARLRLARKTYCQFFTRFGRCNKDGKKCPYIHDPSKVAVCTKFLSASCYNPECKLTHKVIPERMQDCSYFLQGLCSNESCPYRHVNVNPKSPACEDFLRGYCANGNECRKRHTYVCPVFEATGSCKQGSKCKLHHPKNKKKALEEKKTPKPLLKNSRGRYFGFTSATSNNNETTTARVSEEIVSRNGEEGDVFGEKGKFADYVSLEFYDDEVNLQEDTDCTVDPMCDTVSQVSSDLVLPEANLDELIKPIRIMNRMRT